MKEEEKEGRKEARKQAREEGRKEISTYAGTHLYSFHKFIHVRTILYL